jgi:hypothetical protein
MTECTAGFYCGENATSLTRCPAGHFCPSNGTCDPTPCERGTYSHNEGRRACTPCPAGFTTAGTGAISAGDCSVPALPAGRRSLTDPAAAEGGSAEAAAAGAAGRGPLKLAAASFVVLLLSGVALRRMLPKPASPGAEPTKAVTPGVAAVAAGVAKQ